jgi:hypothetical protein
MTDPENLDGIGEIVKADAVIAEPEAKLGRLDSLQPFHIAFLGGDEASEAMQEIDGGVAVDGANVGTGLVGPGDFLSHFFFSRRL